MENNNELMEVNDDVIDFEEDGVTVEEDSKAAGLLFGAACFVAGGIVLPLAKKGVKALINKVRGLKKKQENVNQDEETVTYVDGQRCEIIPDEEN